MTISQTENDSSKQLINQNQNQLDFKCYNTMIKQSTDQLLQIWPMKPMKHYF